jgi:hypothetical protein
MVLEPKILLPASRHQAADERATTPALTFMQ